MTSIPLHCNICPKEPQFSDISHLLTHVASKGHLAQQFKAQVRARQDVSVRYKLDAYDRWYEKHQIEKLLSERMIAKDTKDSGSTASKVKIVAGTTARKRRTNKSENIIKSEGVLDPQLCGSALAARSRSRQASAFTEQTFSEDHDSQRSFLGSSAATPPQDRPSPFLSQPYHGYNHRPYTPRMSEWQGAGSPYHAMTETSATKINRTPLPPAGLETDGESDYFQTFLRSPTRTAYPDPSEITCRSADLLHEPSSPVEPNNYGNETKESSIKESGSTLQSPVLKGIKWPGMSLFDSASLDAQRLRNQKKDESVLEQMEHNSSMVQQMERIYWPDGSLKKNRLITGNVDSSPLKEPTPPPRLPKRKRNKTDNPALTDLSTNVPVKGKKPRTRKTVPPTTSAQPSDLRTIRSTVRAEVDPVRRIYPHNARKVYDLPDDEDYERKLMHGLPQITRHKAFRIFHDPIDKTDDAEPRQAIKTDDSVSSQASYPHQKPSLPNGSGITLSRIQMPVAHLQHPSHDTSWNLYHPYAGTASRALRDENSDNSATVLNIDREVGDEAAPSHTERVTQRYFSVTGDQSPEFFSSMPPGMDFGGLMEPRYHGSTLNPLNSYFRQHRFGHHCSRIGSSSQEIDSSIGLVRAHQEPQKRSASQSTAVAKPN